MSLKHKQMLNTLKQRKAVLSDGQKGKQWTWPAFLNPSHCPHQLPKDLLQRHQHSPAHKWILPGLPREPRRPVCLPQSRFPGQMQSDQGLFLLPEPPAFPDRLRHPFQGQTQEPSLDQGHHLGRPLHFKPPLSLFRQTNGPGLLKVEQSHQGELLEQETPRDPGEPSRNTCQSLRMSPVKPALHRSSSLSICPRLQRRRSRSGQSMSRIALPLTAQTPVKTLRQMRCPHNPRPPCQIFPPLWIPTIAHPPSPQTRRARSWTPSNPPS